MVVARLGALEGQLAYLVERQRKQEELFSEMAPILKEVMSTAVGRLDELDKKGLFSFGRELARVGEKVLEGYSAEDVRRLGDSVVGILDAVRAMTQPEVLAIVGEAGEVLQRADSAQPVGLLGMVRASRNEEVQKGMAVMLEVLRHVGRGAQLVAEQRAGAPPERRIAHAAPAGAQPRAKRALGTERAAPPRAASCAAPPPARGQAVTTMDGVGFTADGHLADPSQWTQSLAQTIASAQGVALGEAHWAVISFARAEFEKTQVSPNVRRLTQGVNIGTKELYALFPRAPARTVARIAGIPKPAGCI